MAQNENDAEIFYSLAALNLGEVAELFQCSERNIRRFISEQGLLRRDDGKFPICTTCWWWLGYHRRKMDQDGDPDLDLGLLTVRLIGVMGFSNFTLKMVPYAESFIRIPMSQLTFERLKRRWLKGIPKDED